MANRLAKDDFVEDDGFSGYVDTGVDDFEQAEESEQSDDDRRKTKCACLLKFLISHLPNRRSTAKKGKADAKGKAKTKAKPPPPAVTPSISVYRPAVSAEKEEDFMSNLLGDMDHIPAKPVVKSRKRKPEPDPEYDGRSSSPPHHGFSHRPRTNGSGYGYSSADSSDVPYLDEGAGPSSGDDCFSPKKKARTEAPGIAPAIERMGKLGVESGTEDADSSFDDVDMDAFMDIDDDELDLKPKSKIEVDSEAKPLKPINGNTAPTKKKLDDTPAWLSVYDSLTVASDEAIGPAASSTATARIPAPSNLSVLEEDGSLRFYWLDYLEHEGKLYFIGKTQDKKSKVWVSICVTVENLERNLFVLPRERRMEEDEDTGEMYETDMVPELPAIYSDFDRLRKKAGIKSFKAKFVKRKYAFGEKDVPREEREWLKVVYPFTGMFSGSTTHNVAAEYVYRAATAQQRVQSQLLAHLRDEHERVRVARAQAQDNGSMLAADQTSRDRQQGCTYTSSFLMHQL